MTRSPFREPAAARAGGYVLAVAGLLVAAGLLFHPVPAALCWGAMAVGMVFFTGVALINGWVMHALTRLGAPATDPLLFEAFNRLLVGYGWLGNPLFLAGLTGIAYLEVRNPPLTGRLPRWLAWVGLGAAVLSWGRGIGSATGLYFLEPLIFANVPAFLWLGLYGLKLSAWAAEEIASTGPASS